MLRKIRIAVASIFFVGVTLLFLDFTGITHLWLGWMTQIQFLPAVLSLNVVVFILLLLLTFLLGRIYCSTICPLGIFQDIWAWCGRKVKKNRYNYSPAKKILRYTILAIFIVALIAGVGQVVALLAPYSTYGRMASNLLSPIYNIINNVLAYCAERANSYMFYTTDVWVKSIFSLLLSAVTFVVLALLAWRNGRTYCNTICPVGTILSFVARFSLLCPVIDTHKCNGCRRCERNCKSACIDINNHNIDYSRCVVCMDCIDNCRQGAISYSIRRKQFMPNTPDTPDSKETTHSSRRDFLTITALIAATQIVNAQGKVDGGLAVIEDKKIPKRTTRIVPPGALSIRNYEQHCIACQLCVSACPNGVLRPSQDLTALMQPESSYERGYCRPECVKCSEVCPTGAIKPITVAEKSATQIGHAVWIKENCVIFTDGVRCGNCARHCPTGAIQMISSDSSNPKARHIPAIDTERCIGCGACENLCPARPFSAIYVEGHINHRTI